MTYREIKSFKDFYTQPPINVCACIFDVNFLLNRVFMIAHEQQQLIYGRDIRKKETKNSDFVIYMNNYFVCFDMLLRSYAIITRMLISLKERFKHAKFIFVSSETKYPELSRSASCAKI